MTTTTIRTHRPDGTETYYQAEVYYRYCQHRDGEGKSDCDKQLTYPSWRQGACYPLGAWEMGLCLHHYIERLREIAGIQLVHIAENRQCVPEWLQVLVLRIKARAMHRTKEGRG